MKKFRIVVTSCLLALLCMTNLAFAGEQMNIDEFLAKRRAHRHHDSDSSDSSSSSSSDNHRHGPSRGPRGKRGSRGKKGHTGHHGSRGRSLQGPAGAQGIQGIQGPQGIPGSGGAVTNFVTAYQITTGTIADTVAPLAFILFPNVSPGNTIAAPIAGVFTLAPGHYEVIYGAKWTPDVAIALLLNGAVVPGTELEPVSNDYSTVSVILNVTAPGTLSVQNQSAITALTLGGAVNQTGAFITIKQLS